MPSTKPLGLWSGVGLVAANMIGAGVLLSTGFIAQSMVPGAILTLFAALTAAGLFRARFSAGGRFPKPPAAALIAAGVYSARRRTCCISVSRTRVTRSSCVWWGC